MSESRFEALERIADQNQIATCHGFYYNREEKIVDPGNRLVRVYRLQENEKYDSGTLYEREGTATSSVHAGFAIDIENLLREPL